jgi:4-diphosphocytidyl-2C-methyl-D-erythritol kinase
VGQLIRAALQGTRGPVPGGAAIDRLTLALPARAKLNLDLRVIGRRPDGFHDIATTIQSIDLHDLLIVSRSTETQLTTTGLSLAHDADNSVLKAHAALEHASQRPLPAHFHLHKRIPAGSGMGGASSDAAAALRALKSLYSLALDLTDIAEQVGADVPYFLHGGRMRAEGRGEKLTPLTMQPAVFVIAWPGIELKTGDVYAAWDRTRGEGPNQLRQAAERVEPRLHAFATELGDGWQMTGSGSAFFKAGATEPKLDCWTAVAHAVSPWA